MLEMKRSNSIIDLEIGRRSSEDFDVEGLDSSSEKLKRKLDKIRRTGSLNSIGMMKICDSLGSSIDPLSCSSENPENPLGQGVIERARNSYEEDKMQDQKKKRIAKPPRPPKAPFSDMKLLREMTELAKLNRTRAQKIKALKKKTRENRSPLSGNILPMIITIVFFWVVIFQGLLGSRV